jgi:hypothetical protein
VDRFPVATRGSLSSGFFFPKITDGGRGRIFLAVSNVTVWILLEDKTGAVANGGVEGRGQLANS